MLVFKSVIFYISVRIAWSKTGSCS